MPSPRTVLHDLTINNLRFDRSYSQINANGHIKKLSQTIDSDNNVVIPTINNIVQSDIVIETSEKVDENIEITSTQQYEMSIIEHVEVIEETQTTQIEVEKANKNKRKKKLDLIQE